MPPGIGITAALDIWNITAPEPWRAPRCILIANQQVFFVDRSRLWIDSLHIKFVDAGWNPRGVDTVAYGHAYMTNTVVEADQLSQGRAIYAQTGDGGVYAEGVTQRFLRVEHRNPRK